MEFKVNEKCIHCGKCIKDCIGCALKFDENKIPVLNEKRCIKCQHCLAICPVGALSILDKNPENSELNDNRPEADKVLNLIKTRRSIRDYRKENLDTETMDKLKDMLNWVPTGVNNHGLHFSFIDDIEVMNELRDYVNGKLLRILTNPALENLAGKFERYKNSFLRGDDVIFRGAPHMIVVSSPIDAPCASVDPVIALSYFELYAQSMGVGTCWCGLAHTILKLFPELCEHLEIPPNYKVGYVMLFGPTDVEYPRATQPETCQFVSVKKGIKNSKISEKIKRYFWNFR